MDGEGKARAEWNQNNKDKLLFIKTFKSITKGAVKAELHKEK